MTPSRLDQKFGESYKRYHLDLTSFCCSLMVFLVVFEYEPRRELPENGSASWTLNPLSAPQGRCGKVPHLPFWHVRPYIQRDFKVSYRRPNCTRLPLKSWRYLPNAYLGVHDSTSPPYKRSKDCRVLPRLLTPPTSLSSRNLVSHSD